MKIKLNEKLKNIAYIYSCSYLFALLVSCNEHYELKKSDLKYIPYKGNEILVFQSDKNRMDTIFLNGTRYFNGCYDPLAIFTDQCDGIIFNCTKSDPNYDRYLDSTELVELVATSSGQTHISFDISLKGSWFYGGDSYSLTEFDKIPNSELTIGNVKYNEVKIFEATNDAKQYEQRENYVERFFWSVSKGFLGLDRRDEKWRLVKIYKP